MKVYFSKILQIVLVCFFTLNVYAQKGTKLSFESSVQYGTQKDNLTIMASTDFNGDFSLESIKAANWIDITKKFNLATEKVPASSGEKDISDLFASNKPLYIAFKYTGKASSKPSQRGWSVQKLALSHKDVSKTFSPSDFNIVNNSENHEGAGWNISKLGIMFRSNQSTIASDSWAIVKVSDI